MHAPSLLPRREHDHHFLISLPLLLLPPFDEKNKGQYGNAANKKIWVSKQECFFWRRKKMISSHITLYLWTNDKPNHLQFKFSISEKSVDNPEIFGQQQRQKMNLHRQTIKPYNPSHNDAKIQRDVGHSFPAARCDNCQPVMQLIINFKRSVVTRRDSPHKHHYEF